MRRRAAALCARLPRPPRSSQLSLPASPDLPCPSLRRLSTSSAAPERVLVIGGGISGLSTVYYLQHLSPPHPSRPRPHLHLVDSQPRLGGWVHTTHPTLPPFPSPLNPPLPPLPFELGPHSLLTRRGDSTLALLQSLHLHSSPPLTLSDPTARRRFLYHPTHRLVPLPTGLNPSLLSFPYLSPLLSALLHELRHPPPTNPPSDESIYDFACRRFGRFVAEEMMDPLVGGIYAGDVRQLSVRSCFPMLSDAEERHGGVLRSMLWGRRRKAPAPAGGEERMEGEEALDGQEWVRRVKANGTYSFIDGMETLPRALRRAVEERGNPAASEEQPPLLRSGHKVEGLRLDGEGVTAVINGREERYDRVISTTSALQLGRMLAHSHLTTNTDPSPAPTLTFPSPPAVSLPPSTLRLLSDAAAVPSPSLLSSLSSSLLSLPYASVYVVHLGYDAAVLPHAGFGLLCSSLHSSDVLGIVFASSTFPSQAPPNPPITRLTVMIGGARYPRLSEEPFPRAVQRALAGVGRMLGCARPPVYVGGGLMEECIPQYVVGHGAWVKGVEGAVAEVNRRLGHERLQALGNALHGVSVNDLITQAKRLATRYYQ